MNARLPIPAVGTEAYRQWRRGEGAYAPKPANTALAEATKAVADFLAGLQARVARLPEGRPEPQIKSARTCPEVDVTDPEWIARHKAWLATEQGQVYSADLARPWAERSAEIRAEHRAEAIRDARQADNQGRWGPRFAGPSTRLD